MAAAFLRDYSPCNVVVSAGRNPSETIDPMAVAVMEECLADLSGCRPQAASAFQLEGFDVVYECPEQVCQSTIEAYRVLRDFIKNEAYLFFRGL